jgi:hypothetical protein
MIFNFIIYNHGLRGLSSLSCAELVSLSLEEIIDLVTRKHIGVLKRDT